MHVKSATRCHFQTVLFYVREAGFLQKVIAFLLDENNGGKFKLFSPSFPFFSHSQAKGHVFYAPLPFLLYKYCSISKCSR